MADAKINFTLKSSPTAPGNPWLVIGADSPEDLVQTLQKFGVDPEAYLNAVGASARYVATDVAVQNLAEGGLAPSVTEAAMQTPVAASTQGVQYGVPPEPQQPQQAQYQAPQYQPPQAAPAQPAGEMCRHGARNLRSGTGKNGRAWEAYMCAAPQGTPRSEQCDPIWVD